MEIWDRAIEIRIAAAQERLVRELRKRARQASPIRYEVDRQHPGTTPARNLGIRDWGLGIRDWFYSA
jgi:hypothetical protein